MHTFKVIYHVVISSVEQPSVQPVSEAVPFHPFSPKAMLVGVAPPPHPALSKTHSHLSDQSSAELSSPVIAELWSGVDQWETDMWVDQRLLLPTGGKTLCRLASLYSHLIEKWIPHQYYFIHRYQRCNHWYITGTGRFMYLVRVLWYPAVNII